MKFSRINETTIRCYLTREDLESSGINLDDIMERKTNAMEYLRRVIMEAAREENFQLDGAVNTMQIRAMMDGSLALTISSGEPGALSAETSDVPDLFRSLVAGLTEGRQEVDAAKQPGTPSSDAGENPAGTDTAMAAMPRQEKSDSASMNRKAAEALNPPRERKHSTFCYIFRSIADAGECCRKIPDTAALQSSLWQDRGDGAYYLFLSSAGDEIRFEKTILAMNEFGTFSDAPAETVAYIMEHERCILRENAAAQLARL